MNPNSLLFPTYRAFVQSVRKRGARFAALLAGGGVFTAFIIYFALYKFLAYVSKAPMLGAVIGPMIGGLLVSKLLEMLYLALFIMIVFSSVIAAFSSFYLDDEIRLLMSSPIPSARIFWSRFVLMVGESSWMAAAFFLPVFLAFATAAQAPLWAYLIYPLYIFFFLLAPNLVGGLLALSLATLFPIRQMRKVFQFLSVMVLAAMVFFFRYMEPEKLLNPSYFGSVSNYILNLQNPLTKIGPSAWMHTATRTLFEGDPLVSLRQLLPLLTLLGIGLFIMHVLARSFYRRSWQISLEAVENQVLGLEWLRRVLIIPLRFASPEFRVIGQKEITVFFRDPAIFSQIFMMAAIIFVYGYNLTILPLKDLPSLYSGEINDTMVYFNGPFIGFIMAAVAMRFVYPSISMEGRAFWAVKASPVPASRLLQVKFILYLVPMMALGLLLCFISNRIFAVTTSYLFLISFLNVFMMSIVITGLAIGLGTVFARFDADNPLKISGSFGGFVFMISCALYVMNLLVLEAYPMFRMYFYRYYPIAGTGSRLLILLSFVLLIFCSALWTIVPLMRARDTIERYEPE
ncbi:MAG TPA: hypothetical protein PLU72_01745 [Candidatus Ozemobacteraceae bacterium]|nr:hypothetical protein [Candidatus Ozemobacteraceae bacterium]